MIYLLINPSSWTDYYLPHHPTAMISFSPHHATHLKCITEENLCQNISHP